MLPAEKKLLKPNPAGCWQFVPAMMHGLLVLCGPTVLPCIGPTSVSGIGTAEALAVSANVAAVAATPIHAKRILPNMVHSFAWLGISYAWNCWPFVTETVPMKLNNVPVVASSIGLASVPAVFSTMLNAPLLASHVSTVTFVPEKLKGEFTENVTSAGPPGTFPGIAFRATASGTW